MTRRNLARNLLFSAVAILCAVVFVGADFAVSAQNSNSSTTTMQNDNMMGNTNTARRRSRGRRGRRGRRRATPANMPAATDAAAPDASGATPADAGAMGSTPQGGMSMGTPGTDVDLSGTYTGTINAPDMNMSGPATLTITGSTFSLDAGGNTQSGTLTAHQWPGQIALSMRFGTELPANIISLRAKKMGASGLSLMSVGNESKKFSFTTGGGGGGRRGRRGRRGGAAMMTPPADAASPAMDASAAPADASATPADAATPARGRRGRRGAKRKTGGNTNTGGSMMNSNNSNTPPPSN